MAGTNKTPVWFDQKREEEFYRSTPKHVLYALARDLAAQVGGTLELNETTNLVRTVVKMQTRIETLKDNELIP